MRGVCVSLAVILFLVAPIPTGKAFDDFSIGCGDDSTVSIGFSDDTRWDALITAGSDQGKTLKSAVEHGRNMWVGGEIERWQGGQLWVEVRLQW